jgi:hypothetical protein
VFAYKFLESPRKPAPDTNQLGMTAFKRFTIDIDPVTDPTQYMTMAGYDYRTGVLSPFDSVDLQAADKRFIQCSGPFDLAPGQTEKLVVAAMCAPFGGPNQAWNARPLDSLVHLANVANSAQYIYDQGWLLPSPPLAPNVTLVPGDNQVRIVWDNKPEVTPDPYWERVVGDPNSPNYDSLYQGYDFQGYMVYKSLNGSDWEVLGRYDKADTIPNDTTLWSYPPAGDSTLPDSLWIKMTNNGLRYTFTDNDVTNGFTYYYCVAAYDWNFQSKAADSLGNPQWDTLILRSGLVSSLSTIPRWEAVNYEQPEGKVKTALGDSTNPALEFILSVAAPFLVSPDTYKLEFGPPVFNGGASKVRYDCWMTNTASSETAFKSSMAYEVNDKTHYALPVFNGYALDCTLNMKTPTSAFDTVFVTSGAYPADRVRPSGVGGQALWASRGASYDIHWQTQPFLTARIYDATHGGVEVPFSRFDNRSAAPANGWCFVDRTARAPTDTCTANAARLYICGGYVALNRVGTTDSAIAGHTSEISDGDVWTAHGEVQFGTAPAYNQYRIIPTPGVARADTTFTLDVKVVPNPYIVFNGWEQNSEQRVVKFTHLPNECTIRIYTTSGDLVKVIHHSDTDTEEGAQPLELGGTATWDFTNESPGAGVGSSGQLIASGVYVWHVESPVGEQVGKLVFIH